ncbi:MAG: NAD-dependent epimerase/dehydratase family protein [Gammaproteobacteria bacterium]|nr:NAD-dependent epimerase/dehydratase family protein [Gammaproteobacteria bacterium]
MLESTHLQPIRPQRVVIIGAGGFVGGAAQALFAAEATPVLALGRSALDLLTSQAAEQLMALLKPEDTVLMAAAEAPCKNTAMLVNNIQMMKSLTDAIAMVQPRHVIYISSDAVYADSAAPLTESSVTAPDSLHGIMHLARERMLQDTVRNVLALLRPTLIYGAADPHNGYGPNRFRRLAAHGEDIVLFGEGEERRDHVLIDDVAELIRRVAWQGSRGVLNIATGAVASFREIAEWVTAGSKQPVAIKSRPRLGAMPHNGYRSFDARATFKAFPDFRYTPLLDGLVQANVMPSKG